MPIEVIEFKGKKYPKFQAEWNSSQYIMPVSSKICKGVGYDIGCGKLEWRIPGAIPIDIVFETGDFLNALNLPNGEVDFIFSSHCLEHIHDWVRVLDYWTSKLRRPGGVLFLYLPHYDQEYWRPWNDKKHKHVFYSHILKDVLESMGYTNIFASARDANDSFSIFGERL